MKLAIACLAGYLFVKIGSFNFEVLRWQIFPYCDSSLLWCLDCEINFCADK